MQRQIHRQKPRRAQRAGIGFSVRRPPESEGESQEWASSDEDTQEGRDDTLTTPPRARQGEASPVYESKSSQHVH
eukprot:g36715.t1